MKVKLKQDQYYVSANGGNLFGKKDEIIDVDPLFVKLIRDKYEVVVEDEAKIEVNKPLEKMNKAELTKECQKLGIEFSEGDIEKMSKAQIIAAINEVIS